MKGPLLAAALALMVLDGLIVLWLAGAVQPLAPANRTPMRAAQRRR